MSRHFDSISVHFIHDNMSNERQLNDFFRKVEAKVRRLLRLQRKKAMPNRFDLTDVVQEVNTELCEAAKDKDSISHFLDTAWLSRVTTGHFCKLQRRNLAQKRSVAREVCQDLETLGYDENFEIEMEEEIAVMLHCLEQLDGESQHAIIRRCYDGASLKQIASELNTSEYGIKTMVESGLNRLQGMMEGARAR